MSYVAQLRAVAKRLWTWEPVGAAPPAPTPAPDHQAYLKSDGTLCCLRHEAEFERRARAWSEASVRILSLPLAWAIRREPDPPAPPPAWKPPGPDPAFVQDLRRRAARWFGRP